LKRKKILPNRAEKSMRRVDGTKKSKRGWLGAIRRDDGSVMTEFSIGLNINGKERNVPSLVPTLSRKEIEFLRTKKESQPIPQSIQKKAKAHAIKMIKQNKSPFFRNNRNEGKPSNTVKKRRMLSNASK
tara:strand:+ start:226 stop:612 length:387 start_codon:yes stop_codon:yes gene_type:complete